MGEAGIWREVELAAYSLLTGAWLMACYDILRVFRILVRHGTIWMGLEDLIYWIYSAATTFWLMYSENDGGLRAYMIGGIFLGMVVYDRFFSRIYLKLLKNAAGWLRIRLHKFKSGENGESN